MQQASLPGRSSLVRFLSALLFIFLPMFDPNSAAARIEGAAPIVTLEISGGKAFALPKTAETIIVVDKTIADANAPTPGRLLLFGKSVGDTEVYAIDFSGKVVFRRRVQVRHQKTSMHSALRQRFPASRVKVSSSPGSVLVTGTADTPRDARHIIDTVTPFAGDDKVINRLEVEAARRVRLYVRLLEIRRDTDDAFGIDWRAILETGRVALSVFTGAQFVTPALAAASGGGARGSFNGGNVDLNLAVDWLEQRGYASILSEPNLTTMSGETARFAVGELIPLPTFTAAEAEDVTSGNFGVTYEFFGLELEFTPEVLSRSSVRLLVDISSSDITGQFLTINGNDLPITTSEDFQTVIELRPGQTFAIAGLMERVGSDNLDRVPVLGSMPVLGRLFSSTAYQQSESDLVVLVTPYFMEDDATGEASLAPSAGRPLTNMEYILLSRMTGEAPLIAPADTPRMPPKIGFAY